MPFSTVQCAFIVEHYFLMQYESVKQVYQVHFPDAAVQNKSTIF
jgi:hypothetical protein